MREKQLVLHIVTMACNSQSLSDSRFNQTNTTKSIFFLFPGVLWGPVDCNGSVVKAWTIYKTNGKIRRRIVAACVGAMWGNPHATRASRVLIHVRQEQSLVPQDSVASVGLNFLSRTPGSFILVMFSIANFWEKFSGIINSILWAQQGFRHDYIETLFKAHRTSSIKMALLMEKQSSR